MADGRCAPTGTAAVLIRRWRAEAALTQQELATRAGVSVGAVRDLEQDRVTHPRSRILEQLADALGLGAGQRADLAAAATGTLGGQARPGKGLWLRVLGAVGCWRDSMPVSLGPARQRAVAALLAVHPNTSVRREAIIDALWPDGPPGSAVAVVQSHVSRLRKTLDGGQRGRLGSAVLVSTGTSYRLEVGPDQLDLLAFQQLAAQARRAAAPGDLVAASRRFERALGLWEGEPLADVDVLAGHPAVVGLTQLHTSVVTEYAQTVSGTGLVGNVLPHLRALAEREPLNERIHAQLMMCLAASGQQAHALQTYEALRQRLDNQLGVRPGPELASTHLRILRQEIPVRATALSVRAESRSRVAHVAHASDPAAESEMVPQQLPAAARIFVGRKRELAELVGLLEPDSAAGTIAVVAIGGTAGVGKTALAVYWAHQAVNRFPDGQLYVNLCGYDRVQPMTPADILAGFLRALGVPGQDIPAEEHERSALYRSRLAGKRMMIVLDNAGSAEQVRPLLPGAPHCAVVVTSRDAMAGLVARDGAHRLDLDLLPIGDAVRLLRELVGTRVDTDPDAAAVLARQCCRLPLALRLAAELAATRPGVPLAGLVDELADQQRRLDLLDAGGDPRTAVRAVFSWSYRHLDAAAARAFRLVGLHPSLDHDPHAAAALIGTSVENARGLLELLAQAHLIQPAGQERYGMHDLLRAYASERAAAVDSRDERRTALTRLYDHYLHTASVAMDTLYPAERHRRPRILRSPGPGPQVTESQAARAWLDAERATLAAVTVQASRFGWPTHATQLAATLFRYLDTGSYWQEAIIIHTYARAAAQQTGDRTAEATAMNHLAGVCLQQSRYQQAADYLRHALVFFQQTGDRVGEACALNNLGAVCSGQGRYQQAASFDEQALNIYREMGDRSGEASALGKLGDLEERQGSYRQAARHHYLSLAIARKIGDQYAECAELINLGTVHLRQGDLRQAAGHLRRALALCRQTSYRYAEPEALTRIGDVCLRQGRPHEASDHLQQALAAYREIGYPSGEADALNSFGEAILVIGQPGHARSQHATALRLASEIGDRHQQARAHDGLARCYYALGDVGEAFAHREEALALHADLGTHARTLSQHSPSRRRGEGRKRDTPGTSLPA